MLPLRTTYQHGSPAARGDDEMLSQTRRLIEEVLPLVAARWPKPAKRRAAVLVG